MSRALKKALAWEIHGFRQKAVKGAAPPKGGLAGLGKGWQEGEGKEEILRKEGEN